MQREKNYNLQSKAYFNCALSAFKKKQNPVRPIFDAAEKSFFSMTTRNSFFLISSFFID